MITLELSDLRGRVQQLMEINRHVIKVDSNIQTGHSGVSAKTEAEIANQAFDAVLTLIEQIEETGQIMRGNSAVPDAVEVILRNIRKEEAQTSLL